MASPSKLTQQQQQQKSATNTANDDLYSGFSTAPGAPLAAASPDPSSALRTASGRPLQTAGGFGFRANMQSRMGTTTAAGNQGDGRRPMTSMRGARYSSRGRPTAGFSAGVGFDPFNQAGRGSSADANRKPDQTPEEQIKILEKKINALIEESTFAADAGENRQAEKYAHIAIQADRYNAKALTNRGNLYFNKGNLNKAREYYIEAISVDASCTESMYNLGLAYKQEDSYDEALGCFEKLHAILRNQAEVIFQLADICDRMGNLSQAMEWFNILISVVPTDPGVLARMGEMFLRDGDKSQAFQYYSESYRYFPSNMDVISWLGAYYVDCAVYEQAVQFFERATLIQPQEVRWPLMVASCHRRSGNYQVAYDVYRKTHETFPNDIECLRFLVRICTDLGVKDLAEYQARLQKAEKFILEEPAPSRFDTEPLSVNNAQNPGSSGSSDHRRGSNEALGSAGGLGKKPYGGHGSAGSGGSSLNSRNGGIRKAVKFDLGEAKSSPSANGSYLKPNAQAKNQEDWHEDVENLLPD